MKLEDIKIWFSKWCSKTKRNGGVLIGKSIQELLVDFDEQPERIVYSDEYLNWIKATKQKNLTSTQHVFAEWCLKNATTLSQIGNLEDIFISIRKHLKH